MTGRHNLGRAEAEWLMVFGRGRSQRRTGDLPGRVVESLTSKGLLTARAGLLVITTKGLAEALRLSTPDVPAPRLRGDPAPQF